MTFEPGEVVAPSDPRIVLEGQWGHQPGVAITVNSGSRLSFSYAGERVQLLFDTDGLTVAPHLWITVDDTEPSLYLVDEPVIELVAPDGRHQVSVVVKDVNEHANRWNPPFGCAVVFAGLVLDARTVLRLSGRPGGPRMEFYGDSITQGVRSLSEHPESEGADGTTSFAYLTARAFGATAYQVGFGSQGISKPGNGEVPSGVDSFGWNFAGSRAERVEPSDVVVINLGVNDPTLEVEEYAEYVRRVRAAYSATTIVSLTPFSGKHAETIQAAVKTLDDPNLVCVDSTGWITEDDCTDQVHPTVAGHTKIADHLISAVEEHTSLRRRM
ncbi:lysophospholipase L1-like esterase [Kribbella aluminosa]|uniref:Lysophospholipase L1-like esterase n=1 Tax=Kribbella aluminosa TaxID=416017 RepID=A0ABS4UIL3_9ACTN|nr:GDSL-type esterase/lipase family protein [Kribbella aluminosa]MBP2351369.1 lysophospholipase L1-like esterase [Kribbella aluminosa]